ncbi:MAG: hypothetical protein AAB655_02540 [Patescibacteria group bacterium]
MDTKRSGKLPVWGIVGVAAILVAVFLLLWPKIFPNTSTELDSFAQCLKDKGAVFYGAFWCPHCVNQKNMFGGSERLLPYVECSTSDGRSQLPVCKDKNIEGYPTWEFADSSRLSGEIQLKTLAEKTGCELPTK